MNSRISQCYTIESINKAYEQGLNTGRYEVEQEIDNRLNKEYVKGKTDGYGEGYQHGFILTKEKITELDKSDLQKQYNKGYESGYSDCSQKLHSIFGERELEIEKDSYQEGYAQAYGEIHAPTTERERQLQEEAWDEGYNSAIEDYLTQGDEFVGNVSCYEFGEVRDCESGYTREQFNVTEGEDVINFIISNLNNIKSYTQMGDVAKFEFCTDNNYHGQPHIPNEETQEAMQEVLGKDGNEFEGVWIAKDGSGKLKVVNINEGTCDVELVEHNKVSFFYIGDTATISVDDLKEHWNKERAECNYIATEDAQLEKELALVEKYPHYYKDIRHLNILDIYRFFDLFGVTDSCIQHSLKKMAVGGKRGSKDYEKDIKEAMDTLSRWEYMQEENKRGLDD